MTYFHRKLESTLNEYLNFFSVVGLRGPRQSGKSTVLKHLLKDGYDFVSFDQMKVRDYFYDDPESFIRQYSNRVVFDEVQLVPELFDYIKVEVDNDRQNNGKYVLTGSGQFTLQKNISESLAGRIGLLTLLPFQLSEMPESLYQDMLYRGGYPELILSQYKMFDAWFESYISTYLEKDIRQLYNIGDLRDFRRFVRLLAANTSHTLNFSYYARDLGVSATTIKRWVSILEMSYIIFLVPPYFNNLGKRIVKSPRVYFYDVGLVSYLTGIETYQHFKNGPMSGAIFENHVIAEIVKREYHRGKYTEVYFYRTEDGMEIDFIVDRKRYKEIFEIKLNGTFRPKMARHLLNFATDDDKAYVIYTGETSRYQTVDVMNYRDFLMEDK